MKFINGLKQFFRKLQCKHNNLILLGHEFKYEKCEYGGAYRAHHYENFHCPDCDKIISKKS